jgi:hypothetical protein
MHEVGHIVAKTFYARISDVRVHPYPTRKHTAVVEEIACQDLEDRSKHYNVRGSSLVEKFISADTFTQEKKVTRTELAEKLVSAGSLPFTVCFLKSRGEERTLRGRLLEHEDLLGRSMVHDFDVGSGAPMRMVDHRTLLWLILNGVKYTLKEK